MEIVCENTYDLTSRVCSRCGQEKTLDQFRLDRRTGKPRAQCRSCHNAYNSVWARENRKRASEIDRRSREKYIERTREAKRRWRIDNPDRVREHKRAEYEKHSETIKARVSRWRKANPDAHRASNLKRRSQKAASPGWEYTTVAKIADRVAFYSGLCVYCGRKANSIDHRIPLSRGGPHLPVNLVPACVGCNSRKHNKTEKEYREVMTTPL